MPIIRIELSPGRTPEQKATFLSELTSLTARVLKCPVESIDVLFVEIEPSNWAHGGKFYAASM